MTSTTQDGTLERWAPHRTTPSVSIGILLVVAFAGACSPDQDGGVEIADVGTLDDAAGADVGLDEDSARVDVTADLGVDAVDGDASDTREIHEAEVHVIALEGPVAQARSEVSGLAWYGDTLIILPQYPGVFSDGGPGAVFALPRSQILAYLDDSSGEPLTPVRVPFDDSALPDIASSEGYEAIALVGDRVFLTIEARSGDGMVGIVVSGVIDPQLAALTLDATPLGTIDSQSGISNMAEESVVPLGDDSLFTIHEANGVAVNPAPVVHTTDVLTRETGTLPFPQVEYRITDATDLDAEGRFWAINYFWTGDSKLAPNADPLAELYGEGPTHADEDTVERLVEFQYNGTEVQLVPTPPIQLELADEARNWEGLARLGERGFLLATDKYPKTILAFVSAETG